MLESQSKAQKTPYLAYYPLKAWVKKFPLAVGAQSQVILAKKA